MTVEAGGIAESRSHGTISIPAERTIGTFSEGRGPVYLIVVFWGDKYRRFFETLCLPSMLAPGNLPVLQAHPGSKLMICTTDADWAALQDLPLFRRLRDFVEPVMIDIGLPPAGLHPGFHMSKGHAICIGLARQNRSWIRVAP